MSGVSDANTPCGVIYHVYVNKSIYGEMIRSVNRARNYHSEGKYYCITFTNPLTRTSIVLSGERILQIVDHPNSITWCSDEERIAGLVLINRNFFTCLLGAFYKAETARNQIKLYCKSVSVPLTLFPFLSIEDSNFTAKGKDILAIMYSSLGNGGLPSPYQ
jgi:hypothetical protein